MSTDTVRLAKMAAYYTRIGLALVPIARGSKAPTGNGWNRPENLITDEAQARKIFGEARNIGVHLGSSRILSLDLDHLDTARLALGRVGVDMDALLETHPVQIQGRGMRLWYNAPEGTEFKRHALSMADLDGQTVTALEVRGGNGHQDIAPGSLHPEGMEYRFAKFPPRTRAEIPDAPAWLLDMALNWDAAKRVMLAEPENVVTAPVSRPPRQYGEGESVITAFNDHYTVRELLTRHGYEPRGEQRYLAPTSSTKLAGVHILRRDDGRECCYSHHGSDPLAGEHTHDAFSVFCQLEHSGEVKAAVKAAAAELGMDRRAPAAEKADAASHWGQHGAEWLLRAELAVGAMQGHGRAKGPMRTLVMTLEAMSHTHLFEQGGNIYIRPGGVAGLAAAGIAGRHTDTVARLHHLADHGFVLGVTRMDPKDRNSEVLIEVGPDPRQLPMFLRTREESKSRLIRPQTYQRRASERKTVSIYTTNKDRSTSRVDRASPPRSGLKHLAFLLAHTGPKTTTELTDLSGLGRRTVLSCLKDLRATGQASTSNYTTSLTVSFAEYVERERQERESSEQFRAQMVRRLERTLKWARGMHRVASAQRARKRLAGLAAGMSVAEAMRVQI